ncbi:hypothetical protein AAGG41_21330, partial [Stenotrophomonas maltophilia]
PATQKQETRIKVKQRILPLTKGGQVRRLGGARGGKTGHHIVLINNNAKAHTGLTENAAEGERTREGNNYYHKNKHSNNHPNHTIHNH